MGSGSARKIQVGSEGKTNAFYKQKIEELRHAYFVISLDCGNGKTIGRSTGGDRRGTLTKIIFCIFLDFYADFYADFVCSNVPCRKSVKLVKLWR